MSVYFPGTGTGADRTSAVPVIGDGIHMPFVTGCSGRRRNKYVRPSEAADRTHHRDDRTKTDHEPRRHDG